MCREILKWKYCYLEQNPHEYTNYLQCRNEFKVSSRARAFKKKFRLKMDDEYYYEMKKVKERLIQREAEQTNKQENDSGIHGSVQNNLRGNPISILADYDKEVVSMTKKTRENFLVYLQFPKCYPDIENEKETFMKLNNLVKIDKDMDKAELNAAWDKYWQKRIPVLCDRAITIQKNDIRKKFENFSFGSFNDSTQVLGEMQALVISDDDESSDDDDVMIIE